MPTFDDPDRWARLRFAIIGPLLAAPPPRGTLRGALEALAQKNWRHPVNGTAVRFSFATLERWYYAARVIAGVKPRLFAATSWQRQITAGREWHIQRVMPKTRSPLYAGMHVTMPGLSGNSPRR